MKIRLRAHFVEALEDIGQAQTRMVRKRTGAKHVPGQLDGILERRPYLRDPQFVAVVHAVDRPDVGRQIDVVHLTQLRGLRDPLQLTKARIGVRQQPAGKLDRLLRRLLALELVDRRTAHRPVDGHRIADRRNEDHIARQQLMIAAGIAVQQQIVQIEGRDQAAVALELDVA